MSGQIFRAAGAAPDAGAPAGGPDDAGGPPVAAPDTSSRAAAPRERATPKSNSWPLASEEKLPPGVN